MEKHGYIYVAINEHLPYVKIGRTNNPKRRLVELNRGAMIPGTVTLYFKVLVGNPARREAAVFRRLKSSRLGNSECFSVSAETAVAAIRRECGLGEHSYERRQAKYRTRRQREYAEAEAALDDLHERLTDSLAKLG
jgi:hypothetical protein